MATLLDWVGMWLLFSVFPGYFIFLLIVAVQEKEFIQSNLAYLTWVSIPPGIALFVFSTLRLYTTSVFRSRSALGKAVLVLSTATMYAGCLLHSVWIGFRWFKGDIRDPATFCTSVLLDAVIFSIVSKRADLIHQRTRQPKLTFRYFCLLLVPAVVSTCFRLWWDPVAWKLVSAVAPKFGPFLLLWTTPLLLEYLFIPEYSQQSYPLFGSCFQSLRCDTDPAGTNLDHPPAPT